MFRCLPLALACSLSSPQAAPAPEAPPAANAAAREWFQDAKFGLFVHWGVFSLLGKGESVMNRDRIPVAEYEKLPPRFNPTRFDPEAWVRTARAAGMRYITVTAKHHDGFCMFDSKLTKYDVVDATPYGRDPLKALADACRQGGIKLFFSYSLLDWHHPDYFPRGSTGRSAGRPERGDWKAYLAYTQGQVRELCTNYGEIGGIWLDGQWDREDADWDLAGMYRMIHALQPGALVGNNHHVAPLPGEDVQLFERDLPGENTAGFNVARVAEGMPLETCLTMNESWGYTAADREFKAPQQVIHALLGAAGRGANLSLGVGPRPDGTIGPEFAERLAEVGQWLDKYGESVYGTRRGPLEPQPWGVSVRKGEVIYLHVLKPRGDEVGFFLPEGLTTARAELFGGRRVDGFGFDTAVLAEEVNGVKVHRPIGAVRMPAHSWMPIDTVVILHPAGPGR